eukprot:TRINITY_DN300_c0_g1_i5.p1 TRINITY_DN300_c0_g1~~TRINITY_DN300_c0_g1_i5.p1  ORF type:complete len:123 (+),score=6.32 TRINITY_DN300_c0_g1_i5:199-567(+)
MCRFRTESVGALNKIDGGWSKQIKFHVERDEYYSQIGIQVWQPATLGADVSKQVITLKPTQLTSITTYTVFCGQFPSTIFESNCEFENRPRGTVEHQTCDWLTYIRLAMVVLQDKSAKPYHR